MGNYKSVSECPTNVRKWLDLINSVPLGSGFHRGWDILWGNAYFELTGEDIVPLLPLPLKHDYGDRPAATYEQQENLERAAEKATSDLKERSKKFPKLYSYLFVIEGYPEIKNEFDEFSLHLETLRYERTAFQRYETFLDMELGIRKIAQSCMLYHKEGRFIDNEATLAKLGFKRRDEGYPSNFTIKEGKIDFESELIQVLRGIDAERLRICPICNDVFWAKKINSKTCGEQVCIDGLQNYKKKRKTKKEEKTNNNFEISDQRQAERKEFLIKDFSKKEK